MDKAKETRAQDDLNNAAEDSVKGAIERGRNRRAGRPSVGKGDVVLDNPARSGGTKRVTPMDQKQFVPYLKRRRTSLIPPDDHGEDDDSNDEWEEEIQLDPQVMEAAVASLKDSIASIEAKDERSERKDKSSTDEIQQRETQQVEKPSEADLKSRQRLQAATKRKKFLLRHSIHIVLSIANCIRLDAAANDEDVRGFALSITPVDTVLAEAGFSESLSRFALWLRAFFQTTVLICDVTQRSFDKIVRRPCSASERAIEAIRQKGGDILDILVAVAAIIRSQGFRCRIVTPLQLVSHKAPISVRKENKTTGRKQVLETQPEGQTDLIFFGWVEVWAVPDKKWISLDVFGGHVCYVCPTESMTSSIERIPALDADQRRSRDSNLTPDSPGDSNKGDGKRRKSKRVSKRQRRSPSPVRKLRSVKEETFSHVVAVENGRVTDVTRRYIRNWRDIEKARAKGRLFEKAIDNLSVEPVDLEGDEALRFEQEEFDKIAAQEAIPTSITAIQRHPRYILERHLKKYEIIFPKEPIVGYIKEEPIFLRANVQLLHTTDRWTRQMREVIEGVAPLKSVRSMNGTDATVDLFGFWQTNPLVIPPCINGKVPRGIHGNVDLWTRAHLPRGTEHINMPYAKNAARKLQVDFVPAMTGFDIRGGRSVPRIEGIVVALENADLVRDSAMAAAEQAAEKMEQKAKQEALQRWLKLFRAVKARRKVKRLYGSSFADNETYEAAQKREGLKRAQQGKGNNKSEKGSSVSEGQRVASAQILKNSGSKAHTHEFDEPRHMGGDTMLRTCKVCGLEMTFEVL